MSADKIIRGLCEAIASAKCEHAWTDEKVIREDDKPVAIQRHCQRCLVYETQYLSLPE